VSDASHPKVLVFIVTYAAERHIASVFERVPAAVWDDRNVDFLVIDDASPDASVDAAMTWARDRHPGRITILRNPVNQGYGGNQKLGYRIAIDRGYDFVILLHGDGQYAPELLPKFIELHKTTGADVVLGTRMDSVKSARAGGMPWYKVVGNKFLSKVQNRLTRQKFSEWHTGYRGYATKFLAAVPFEVNTNDFHFDTEILLQAVHVGAKVRQFPIPTRYGDETCHVDGKRYAGDVMLATLQFRLHQMGMMCSLKYRNLSIARYRDKTHTIYSSHARAIELLKKAKPKTVLDLGCGPGHVARELRKHVGCEVVGVDAYPPDAGTVDKFVRADLDRDELPLDAFDFDAVLLLDVIEHLAEPEGFLTALRNKSRATAAVRKPPLVVITTPNVAFFGVRLNLLAGRFNYAERGILDITHKRLFTKRSLKRAMEESGYRVEKLAPIAAPFEAVMGGRKGKFFGSIAQALASIWPGMFAFQWLVVARPRPGVQQLLAQSERHLVPAQSAGELVAAGGSSSR
jgi:glycosyltransferase involved in cell wall biosynthesis